MQKITFKNNVVFWQIASFANTRKIHDFILLEQAFNQNALKEKNKKFLKKFDIKYKIKNESLRLKFKGKVNILNRKVKFDLIEVNENFKASKEDLNYFKTSFENILFDQNFINIFNRKKIRKFLQEIS